MLEVVAVVFKKGGKSYYFLANNLDLKIGSTVVVETERGLQYGHVVLIDKKISDKELKSPLKKVLRKTTKKDYLNYKKNLKAAEEAMLVCAKLIKKHNLPMNLIDANFTLDCKQLLFRFVAVERVDFRKLVKDLAAKFKTRIELRQIGVRDKAGEVGGIGPCGRSLCCSQLLCDFNMVSINMAKNQNITLNPTKVNGLCGRLLCCLAYENETYTKLRKGLPNIGDTVKIKGKSGEVVAIDVLKHKYKVLFSDNSIVEVNTNEKVK